MVKGFLDELCRGEVIQDMQPPAVKQPRGHPRDTGNRVASRNISSTQRDPSSFEYVEGRSSATRRCGVCGGTGHNRRRCPLTNSESSSLGSQIPSQEEIPIEVNLRDSDSENNWGSDTTFSGLS